MNRLMKRIIFAFLIAAACCACKPKLVILHVNDTHSHFEPVKGGDRDSQGGCIERAAFVDSVRNAMGEDNVLLVHAGDFSQGSSYFTELGGTLEMKVINDMAYDCVTLGNHEFDNDIEALCERLKMLTKTKVVCANLDLSSFELGKYVSPYAIFNKGGKKIGIIGLETDLSSCVSKTVSSRIPQLDRVEVVNKWENHLHTVENCDMILVLSHLGYEGDLELAQSTKWVNMIIGGHSHSFVDDIVYVNNILGHKVGVVTDGCWGLQMGEIDVY